MKIFKILILLFVATNINAQLIKTTVLPEEYIPQIKKSIGNISHKMKILIFKNSSKESTTGVALFNDLQMIYAENITIKEFDSTNVDEIKKYNVKFFPSFIFIDEKGKDRGIIFQGTPMGYELKSVLAVIRYYGMNTTELPKDILTKLKKVTTPNNLEVMVTPSCPYCANASITAHALAFENDNIIAINVDAQQNTKLSQSYRVSSVPLIIYNHGSKKDVGALPPDAIIDEILNLQKLIIKKNR